MFPSHDQWGVGNTAQTIAPTSEVSEFNPQIDEIIEEAFERTGVRGTRTGYQLRSARRSLNIMFQEWGNSLSSITHTTMNCTIIK